MAASSTEVAREGSLRGDVLGGLTTFATMAYIVVVNPAILATPGTGMAFSGVMTATVVLAATMTLFMGLYAKIPFGVAPGMGINAFFTFTIVLGKKVPWPTALGIVFWAGVLFALLSVTPVRESIARAIPPSLKHAAAAGIGAFLAFIGLRNAGLVAADPVTFVRVGHLGAEQVLAVLGLFVMAWMMRRKSPFAFLAGIGLVTVLGVALGKVKPPDAIVSMPDFSSVFLKLDVRGALSLALLPAALSILFTDLFDSLSTFVGVADATGLVDEKGNPRGLRQGLVVDAFATLGAALVGTSSGTAYIESAAGIEAGGRTGRAAVVTAACFVPCLFLGPLAGAVPAYATGPVLVLVGALMFRSALRVDVSRVEDLVPVFLTVMLIPLTFSITQGMLWGFVSHVALYAAVGRIRDVTPAMGAIAAVSVGLLVLEQTSL